MDAGQEAAIKAGDDIISKIYRGPDGGRTPYKTYLDAREIDPTITLDWVRGWFRKNVERTKQIGGARNSYVAPRAYHEYQVDLFFITERQFQNQFYEIGMSMIDVFTKFAVVIPLESKYAVDVMPALFKAFDKIGKWPKILMSDKEGALLGKEAVAAYKEAKIQHVIVNSAHFVERFNRTFKNMLADRMNKLLKQKKLTGKQKDPTTYQWSDLIPHVMAEYNNKNKHRIIGMTPTEAQKPSSHVDVKLAMELVARRGRRFPTLSVGDVVRILKKKNPVGEKEFMDNFKPGEFTVESMNENFGQKFYKLSNGMEYIRSDIVRMKN